MTGRPPLPAARWALSWAKSPAHPDTNIPDISTAIAEKDFDVDGFVQWAILDEAARDEIIRLMVTDANIMVYYHCYYVVSRASQEHPELFYPYWQDIASLLNHPNSYHRNFALCILANLTRVDRQGLFSQCFEAYFARLHDPRLLTAQSCIQGAAKVIRNAAGYRDKIIPLLIDLEQRCAYPSKQLALLKYDVLVILDEVYETHSFREDITRFISAEVESASPKTRKKARELVNKYGL